MTADRRSGILKWTAYTAAFLVVYFFSAGIFSAFPIFGAVPAVIPGVIALVAGFEGGTAGAAFGLALGLFGYLAGEGPGPSLIFLGALVGMLAGARQDGRTRHPMLRHLLLALFALVLVEGVRVLGVVLFGSAPWQTLLRIAGGETLYSFALMIPAYPLFRQVWSKLGTPR